MSKYDRLWKYVQERGESRLCLTFDEISAIAGVPLDHSFFKLQKGIAGIWL